QPDRQSDEASGASQESNLDRSRVTGLEGAGEKRRHAQAPDAVTIILKGVVAAEPLTATAGTRGDADRAEPVAEAIAHERSRSPRFGRRHWAPGAMAAREVDGITDRVIVHDHTPPAPPGAELDDRDLVHRSGREAGSDLVILRCLVG